jgi:hypothetical protein
MSHSLQSLIESSKRTSLSYEEDFRVEQHTLSKFCKGHIGSASEPLWNFHLDCNCPAASSTTRRSSRAILSQLAPDKHGQILAGGGYNTMSELYKHAPDLVLKPHTSLYEVTYLLHYLVPQFRLNIEGNTPFPSFISLTRFLSFL